MFPKRIAKIAGVCLAALLLICILIKKDRIGEHEVAKEQLADFDLILSKGQSLQSKLVSILNFTLMDYTHIGIIHRVNDEVYVLHSTPDGVKDNGIRYDRLDIFLDLSAVSDITVLRMKNISETDRHNLGMEFERYKNLKAPFDYDFNNLESKKICCTELVYLIFSHSKLLNDNDFEINKPIHPKAFLKLSSFCEVDCKK